MWWRKLYYNGFNRQQAIGTNHLHGADSDQCCEGKLNYFHLFLFRYNKYKHNSGIYDNRGAKMFVQ